MLMRVVRVLVAAFLAVSGLVLATSAPAFACKCQAADIDRQAERADAVFLATVEEVKAKTEAPFKVAVDLKPML